VEEGVEEVRGGGSKGSAGRRGVVEGANGGNGGNGGNAGVHEGGREILLRVQTLPANAFGLVVSKRDFE
jgi:hypothetical protein